MVPRWSGTVAVIAFQLTEVGASTKLFAEVLRLIHGGGRPLCRLVRLGPPSDA